MDNFVGAFQLPILTLGRIAGEMVSEPGVGQVEAVFKSSFYIRFEDRGFANRQSDEQYICLGHAALVPGPLNCVTAASSSTDWHASGLKCGDIAVIGADVIRIGNKFAFLLATQLKIPLGTSPSIGSTDIDKSRLSRGITAFRRAAREHSNIDGLGLFLNPEYQPQPHHHCCTAASGQLAAARHWLATGFRSPQCVDRESNKWIEKLSGLGPGLTPSGDDFLGGLMIALNHLGEHRLKNLLWQEVGPQVRSNSNAISLAHLSAAARGLQSTAIDDVLNALASGSANQIERTMHGIAQIGHSSGWDIMTGVITAFEVWLQITAPVKLRPGIH